jgi:hypothetical protein
MDYVKIGSFFQVAGLISSVIGCYVWLQIDLAGL